MILQDKGGRGDGLLVSGNVCILEVLLGGTPQVRGVVSENLGYDGHAGPTIFLNWFEFLSARFL